MRPRFIPLMAATTAAALSLVSVIGPAAASTKPTSTTPASSPAAVARVVAYLSPIGTSTTCTASAPCGSLTNALSVAGDGGTVYLTSGQYPDIIVNPTKKLTGYQLGVTVTPAPGATPVVAGMRIYVPRVTFTGLTGHGVFYFATGSDGSSLLNSHLSGPNVSVLVRSSHDTVQNNLLEGGQTHDGINVAATHTPNTDTLIAGNTVRDFNSGPAGKEHADCIQMFDTDRVTIVRNTLYDCYNSGITFSPGASLGITNIVVESNFIEGCISTRMQAAFGRNCGNGGSSVDVRGTWIKSASLNHNTIVGNSARLPAQPGITADANIIGYLSLTKCATSLTNSLMLNYTLSACSAGLPGAHNVLGKASFVGQASGNLRLLAPLTGAPTPPTVSYTDIDGQPFTGAIGADQ